MSPTILTGYQLALAMRALACEAEGLFCTAAALREMLRADLAREVSP